MKTGRPVSWNPIAALLPGVWTDVVPLTSKDRMVFPVAVRSSLRWLSATTGILVTLGTDPLAELLAWEPDGAAQMERLKQMLIDTAEPNRGELAIAAMDRYLRLTIDGTGRAVIPAVLVSHLEADDNDLIRVVLRNGRLWLWSERFWQAERTKRLQLLDAAGLR